MHKIERELIEATKYKSRQKYIDRQDYLKSLFLASTKLSNSDFDELSNEAADWINDCVTIHNAKSKEDFPDFDEAQGNGEDVDEKVSAEDEDAETDPEDEDDDTDPEDDSEDDDDGVEASPEEAATEEPEEEPEPEPVKTKKRVKETNKTTKEKVEAQAKRGPKPSLKEKPRAVEAVLDKWGCIETSKNSQALFMFEKGATAREVKDALGGTYYNALGKMMKSGHSIRKEGSIIYLTHKNDVQKPKKGKK